MDAANVDLKGFSERFYRELCGGHLQAVLDTLYYLKHYTRVWTEITTLLIPGENDSEKEVDEETRWIFEKLGPDVPLHFTAFHPDWQVRNIPPTPLATLRMARSTALKNGLRYVYTGNVYDEEGSATWCHACQKKLIGRDGYQPREWNLTPESCCKFCGALCGGVFDAKPGNWGARRLPVTIEK
jgi:pyruvate formate lyase activating enzyme